MTMALTVDCTETVISVAVVTALIPRRRLKKKNLWVRL